MYEEVPRIDPRSSSPYSSGTSHVYVSPPRALTQGIFHVDNAIVTTSALKDYQRQCIFRQSIL
jgi:hypothetical protein